MNVQKLVMSIWHNLLLSAGFDLERSDTDDLSRNLHVRQISSMDCGEACIAMVLKWVNPLTDKNWIHNLNLSQPCWSIDIFITLKELELDVFMYTRVRGFSPDNYGIAWYEKNMNRFEVDRCNEQFRKAENLNWEIKHSDELSISAIADYIRSERTIAIILVDDAFLKRKVEGQYAGHYVVLVDCNDSTFFYLDPATDPEVKKVSWEDLETARTQCGTDHDIILINK